MLQKAVEPNVDESSACTSFQQFVQAHETAVFTFCYRMLGDIGAAEDVAENAFLDTWLRFPALSLLDVLAAARCRCRDKLQHNDHQNGDTDSNIQYLFNKLSVSDREVMALRYGCKLDFTEIAAILNTSCEAVRNTLRQGRWNVVHLEEQRFAAGNSSPKR